MALQIPELYNFGNAQAGIAMQQQSTKYLADQMANLGAQISESISMNNARKEAEELQPFIQSQYQRGFQEIENGNVAQGISSIYGVGSQIAGNPILGRIAQDANQAASYAATAAMRRRLSEMEYEQKTDFENLRQSNRIELKEEAGMTPSAVQSAERYMLGLVNKLNDPEATISEQRNNATALQQAVNRMQAAGQEVGAFDVNPALNGWINEKLKPLTDTLNDTLKMAGDSNLSSDQRNKLLSGAKELENEIKKIRSFEIKVDQSAQPTAGIEGAMPVQNNPYQGTPDQIRQQQEADAEFATQNDIIPIVPEDTGDTPQSVLQAVKEGRMTKEQARKIAQERGWK